MRVRWLRQALLDLDEIESYIAGDSPAVAIDVIVKIIKAVSLLREHQPRRSGRSSALLYPPGWYCQDRYIAGNLRGNKEISKK